MARGGFGGVLFPCIFDLQLIEGWLAAFLGRGRVPRKALSGSLIFGPLGPRVNLTGQRTETDLNR